ncbi:26797_t:CDS:2, partial [Gigaspora margarita]
GIESFDRSINVYIKSLNCIIALEQQGKRYEKARILLKMEPQNDYKLARKWAMRKLANNNSVYFYNPKITITGNSVVGVGISNNGTFNSISKRNKKISKTQHQNARSNLVNEVLVALGKMMRASLDKSLNDRVDIVICELNVI